MARQPQPAAVSSSPALELPLPSSPSGGCGGSTLALYGEAGLCEQGMAGDPAPAECDADLSLVRSAVSMRCCCGEEARAALGYWSEGQAGASSMCTEGTSQ
ncbi:MAG: hypothetical protein KC501_13910 [Myxococcales bacterium]|nr:hypothetical protein [Myxococcales bacterium]